MALIELYAALYQEYKRILTVRQYEVLWLKEGGGAGRMITTGVRWAESTARKKNRGIYEKLSGDISKRVIINNDNDDKRRLFESCRLQAKRVCNPIIDWSDQDVWDCIEAERIETNPLYKCGFDRVGCVGCPMAGKKGREFEFARCPTYQRAYIRAFDRMLDERRKRGLPCDWQDGKDVFHWWMEDGVLPGQVGFEEMDV